MRVSLAIALRRQLIWHGDYPYVFQYAPGTGELTKVTTPASGTLGWSYRSFSYNDGNTFREVTTRTMRQSPSGLTNTWSIGLDDNTAGHASTTITDNGAGTSKVWNFGTTAGPLLGLVSSYQEKGASSTTLQKEYTWAQDRGAGRTSPASPPHWIRGLVRLPKPRVRKR